MVKMFVVVGGFVVFFYFMENIKWKFLGVVLYIFSFLNLGSVVCQGVVVLVLNFDIIEFRVCKRIYGFSCMYKFERGVDLFEYMKVVDGVEKCRRWF